MDDGTLVIDHYSRTHKIQIFPRVALYTLCFSYEENLILMNHIKNTFDIQFKLKKRPDGKNYILEINRRNEVYKFIELIKKYVLEIPEMHYKVNIEEVMEEKYIRLKNNKSEHRKVLTSPLQVKSNFYTHEEIKLLLQLKDEGFSIPEIARRLDRTYWGVVDKFRRLKSESK